MTSDRRPRVALVHDYLLVMRGAERTFAAMAECWPDAPLFTLLYDEETMGSRFPRHRVRTSYLQALPVRQRGFRAMLPLFPRAAERLPLADFDIVVSSSSAFAHGVRPRPGAMHLSYCYTPFRYAWFERERALAEMPRPLRPALGASLERIRRWDLEASRRVTRYVAISVLGQQRIAECYGRSSALIHPPVELQRFSRQDFSPADYFLVVCELVRHKRVDVAIAAARRAGRPIKIVGTGPDERRLRELGGAHAEFFGRVDDETLAEIYARAHALIVPNVEEFGIAAVEAQASGRPVVAVARGGALETVLDGETGVLVGEDPDDLARALSSTDFLAFDPETARRNSARFSTEAFRAKLLAEVSRAIDAA